MNKQKYQRGNLVRVLVGHLIHGQDAKKGKYTEDISPEQVGKLAIIQYSYKDKFGGSSSNECYSVMFQETGASVAWKYPHELELVNKGGEHLFKEAEANRRKKVKRAKKPKACREMIKTGKGSSVTVLKIFEMFNYNSSFAVNGEFYVLYRDWGVLRPVFQRILKATSLDEAMKGIVSEEKARVEKLYNFLRE
jgi:hypothetical protein